MYKKLTVLKIKLAKMCSINEPCLVLCDNKHLWPLFADAKKNYETPSFSQLSTNSDHFFLKKCADLFPSTQYYQVAEEIVPRISIQILETFEKIH